MHGMMSSKLNIMTQKSWCCDSCVKKTTLCSVTVRKANGMKNPSSACISNREL